MLIVCICSPYLFTFFDSIFKSLFGNKPWPTLKILFLVLIFETAHSFGICIFVFRVLPKLDVARAILMMNAVCTVPGLLKLLLSKTHVSIAKRFIIVIIDFAAVLMQCTVFGIVFASKYMFKSSAPSSTGTTNSIDSSFDAGGSVEIQATTESIFDSMGNSDTNDRFKRQITRFLINQTALFLKNQTSGRSIRAAGDFDDIFENPTGIDGTSIATNENHIPKVNNATAFNFEDILASFQIEWELPIALMLVSLVWWENFVDRDIKCGTYKLVNMKLLKDNIIATRCKTNFISSLWKILVTLLFAYIFHPGIFNTSKIFKTPDDPVENRFKYGGDFGMYNFMNQGPNQMGNAFGPLPPPPIPLSKRSVDSADDNNSTALPVFLSFLKENLTNHNQSDHEYSGVASNMGGIHRQIQLPAFTALPQLSPISTIPNMFNLKLPGGEFGPPDDGQQRPPPPPEITFKDRWYTYLIPMILQVLCSGLCYYTGRLACKLCMQRLGFALPLTLVTPVTLSIALILCKWFPESASFQPDFVYWTCHEGYQTGSFKWQVICGLGLWWISQLWIGGHVWFGKGQRLAFTERFNYLLI